MTDGEFQRSATVDVVVDNINDPPEANNDLETVDEDSGFNTILVRDNDNAGPGGESEDDSRLCRLAERPTAWSRSATTV